VRQHSKVHDAALGEIKGGGRRSSQSEEVLATFRAIKQVPGPVRACRVPAYVVSFTRDSSDIANVYALADAAVPGGPAPELEVIPLFRNSRGP